LCLKKITLNQNSGSEATTVVQVFDNILLVPGAGHMEMNLVKAIFSVLRDIGLEDIVEKFGFKSKNAKDYIIKGYNHHLSWQVLYIILMSFSAELIFNYVKSKGNVNVSIADFQKWVHSDVKNPNFLMWYDLVFDWLLGLYCFRSGVRRGNSEFTIAGRQKIAPIMFIQNHPIYQMIIFRDMQIRCEAPDEVRKYIESNESFSPSGDHYRGEGGDFIVENENRSLKSHLPPGVPTLRRWVLASRSLEKLKENRRKVFEMTGLKDPKFSPSSPGPLIA
jgi:hypothetical protein